MVKIIIYLDIIKIVQTDENAYSTNLCRGHNLAMPTYHRHAHRPHVCYCYLLHRMCCYAVAAKNGGHSYSV